MIAHLDCYAGASGDMILAAFIDAGAEAAFVQKQLSSLGIPPVQIGVEETHRGGLRAARLVIDAPRTDRVLKGAKQIRELFAGSSCDREVARVGEAVILRLAAAEASVHGVSIDEVHFHEIDGIDTVVDSVGVAAALASLGWPRVTSTAPATGTGVVQTAHGALPVPAPAVTELMKGLPVSGGGLEAELLTPTGAAILAEVVDAFGPMPAMTIGAVGYGAGSRELAVPNVVRVTLGEEAGGPPAAAEVEVQANIDDMNPEIYEYVVEKLFAAGALDAWVVPAIGKRGRPAQVLHALCPADTAQAVRDVMLSETSTIGVREAPVRRYILERAWVEVEVAGARVRVKVAMRDGRAVNVAPEYADCADAARRTGMPLKEVFQAAVSSARSLLAARVGQSG